MDIKSIMIETKGEKYDIRIFPMVQEAEELVLAKDRLGKNIIRTASAGQELTVDRQILEALAYAYVFVRDGEKYGTPVRILTRPPVVQKLLLQSEGRVKIIQGDINQYTRQAGLTVKFTEGEQDRGEAVLESGVWELDLVQAGIVYDEKVSLKVQIRHRLQDENHTMVYGPVLDTVMVLNPPELERVVKDEKSIEFKLAEEAALPLYARLYCNGQEICTALQCTKRTEGNVGTGNRAKKHDGIGAGSGILYTVMTDTLNLNGDSYAFSIACRNEQTASYWSTPVPLLTKAPEIKSAAPGEQGWSVWMREAGYYCWQGNYSWTDHIETAGSTKPEIRYADQCDGFISLGPPAGIMESSEECFVPQDGFYYREHRSGSRSLTKQYADYENTSFQILEKDGKWSLTAKEGYQETVGADFKELLARECTSYAQLEELSESFGEMCLKPEDMLSVRYGYRPDQGICDIRAGMALCFDYGQYQNIPEADRYFEKEVGWPTAPGDKDSKAGGAARQQGEVAETVSDRNLSGFTGNGSSLFYSILRDGAVTFEPFAQEAAKSGRMTVEPPRIEQDGRIAMGVPIWDTLFTQFQAPFVRLMYPAGWKQSGHLNHGSMYYYDNVCMISADSYSNLEDAAKRFLDQTKPSENAAYLCFRGRTAVKPMIHIFVEGHPQICALGTTLGDIIATYGLGGNVLLRRLYAGQYLPFVDVNPKLPLYIGDRICSR